MLNHSAKFSGSTAVLGPPLRDHRLDVAFAKFAAMWFGVVAAIGANDFGLLKWPATHSGNRRNRRDEPQQLGDVVVVRAGQDGTDGDAIGIDEDVVLGTGARAIRGIRASFSTAPTAPTDDESTAARKKSSWPASRNFASRISCNRSYTPAFCQSRKRRHQVGPEPNLNLIDRPQAYPGLEQDAVQCSLVRNQAAGWIFLALRLWRQQQTFDQGPQLVSSDWRGHPLGSRCADGQG
ncbi:hypothetical protein SAMN05444172_8400 [Burkholderia sp. GAS332]|nr:hypothetical protein SAMN05444172_8400 [Burkholderia sp. GAS332]